MKSYIQEEIYQFLNSQLDQNNIDLAMFKNSYAKRENKKTERAKAEFKLINNLSRQSNEYQKAISEILLLLRHREAIPLPSLPE